MPIDPDSRMIAYYSNRPSHHFPTGSPAWRGAKDREAEDLAKSISDETSAGGVGLLLLAGYAIYALFVGLVFEVLFIARCIINLVQVLVPRAIFYSRQIQLTWFTKDYLYGYASLANLASCAFAGVAILLAVRAPAGRWISLTISASIILHIIFNKGIWNWQMPVDNKTIFFTMLVSVVAYRVILTALRRDERWLRATISIAVALTTAFVVGALVA